MIITVAAPTSSRVHCSIEIDTDGRPVPVCGTVAAGHLEPRSPAITSCARCIALLTSAQLSELVRIEKREERALERGARVRAGQVPAVFVTDDTAAPCRSCGAPIGQTCCEDCPGWLPRQYGEWFVTWHHADRPGDVHVDRVQIIEGYTTLSDASGILALYHLGRADLAPAVIITARRRAEQLSPVEADTFGIERPGRVCRRAGHAWRLDESTSHQTPSGRTIRQQRTCRRCGECDDVFLDGPTGRELSFDEAQARLFDGSGRTS